MVTRSRVVAARVFALAAGSGMVAFMRVTTRELRRACEAMLEHLEATEQREIEIAEDYDWAIAAGEAYAAHATPSQFTMGQLSDDWREVMAIVNGDKEAVGYALVWLAAVLRRIGETTY